MLRKRRDVLLFHIDVAAGSYRLLFFVLLLLFFFYLDFLSRTFTIHRTAGEGASNLFKSSLPLPPASQTLRRQLGDYCRKFTSAHSQQSRSNREHLVSEHKPLSTTLPAIVFIKYSPDVSNFQRLVFDASCLHIALLDQL